MFSVVISALGDGEYRAFADKQGREIQAKIVRIASNGDEVCLERDNRRRVTVPIGIFSDETQRYIKEWASSQSFLSEQLLKVAVSDEVERRKEEVYSAGDLANTKQIDKVFYDLTFSNTGAEALDEMRMEYRIFYEQSKQRVGAQPEPVQKVFDGAAKIPVAPSGGEVTVRTDAVEIYEDVLVPRYFGLDTYIDDRGGEGNVHGIWVRVYLKLPSGTELMREVCKPNSIKNKFQWEGFRARTASSSSPNQSDRARLNKQFGRFDANHDGRIELDEWLDAKEEINGARFSRSYATMAFERADSDGSKYLNEDEFKTTS
ncbi:EF-hand domain-containing protein [Pontiella sp.]|uniref:EF-hand domain-containing protein n=1 Tax=Pontiella sp. TaxID=2837462 RepID=UPI0035623B9A